MDEEILRWLRINDNTRLTKEIIVRIVDDKKKMIIFAILTGKNRWCDIRNKAFALYG